MSVCLSLSLSIYIYIYRCRWTERRHSSCNGYRRRKWNRRREFKSWTRSFAFHSVLRLLRKVCIQLFSILSNGWIVGQSELSDFVMVISLIEIKLWIQTYYMDVAGDHYQTSITEEPYAWKHVPNDLMYIGGMPSHTHTHTHTHTINWIGKMNNNNPSFTRGFLVA